MPSDEETIGKGKNFAIEIEKRKFFILETLIRTRQVSVEDLVKYTKNTKSPVKEETLRKFMANYCRELRDEGGLVNFYKDTIYTYSMVMAERWKETAVGKRLGDEGISAKAALAEKVINFLVSHSAGIESVLLSSGISVYKVSEELFSHRIKLPAIRHIYTTSILILDHFLFARPKDMSLLFVGNEFIEDTGSLKFTDYKQEKSPDNTLSIKGLYASILGFTGLSKEGFYVDKDWEVNAMGKLLLPERNCALIIIPMEWVKIGPHDCYYIKTEQILEDGKLNCPVDKDGKKAREYILVTNPPNGDLNSDLSKKEVIDYWKGKGMKIVTP